VAINVLKWAAAAVVVTALAMLAGGAAAAPAGPAAGQELYGADALAEVPVGGNAQVDNACYVRLPDLPRGLYGGFGGYNPDTGVLFHAGGAEKRTADNTIVYHDLYALKLDGGMTGWNTIPYSANVGYLRQTDRGCREMANVQIANDRWVSIGGKDGCDGTTSRRGDIKEMQVGETANAQGVRWTPNSRVDYDSLPPDLKSGSFRLVRLFAAWDEQRGRLVFGQGTFDDEKDTQSQDKIYQATKRGSVWNVTTLRPGGTVPVRRFGTCAAYVRDADSGVDGVMVLGGQQGGVSGTTSYNEVWWLDFSKSVQGEWSEITSRFTNMDEIGFRREGACAYNPETKVFYSWMGRANSRIPDGASRSSGAWMTDLTQLGDSSAQLTWQRLAKDKLDQPKGRRLIPSIYDARHDRFFALGGRNDLDEWSDAWIIYPGVTGPACENLDPFATFRTGATPTTPAPAPTAPAAPTTPAPGPTAPPQPTAAPQPEECPHLAGRVPAQARADALANPGSVYGYGLLCNPNLPPSPFNTVRDRLTIKNASKPYHPLYNALQWSCGCP